MEPMILVYIVSPVRVYRAALAQALEVRAELRVVGSAGTAEHARGQIENLGPDVVLFDMSAPGAVAAACMLADTATAAKLVAFAAEEDDRAVIACAEAGVSAFVAREGTFDDIVAATEAVMRGETMCSPRVAAALLRHVADGARERPLSEFAPLTSRERQVVTLIDQGLSNKEIAARLCIEPSTVKNHVHNLLEKLGARGRAEAAARVRVMRSRATAESELSQSA
jgi:two-component system nitrate/nitrite response regulator NarL